MSKEMKKREEVYSHDQWNLTTLYVNSDIWQQDYQKLEAQLKQYDQFMGRLAESADVLLDAIEFDMSLSRQLEKLYTYAHLKSDEDKANQTYLALYDKIVNLYTRAGEKSSFLVPEMLAIPKQKMESFLNDPRFKQYQFYVHRILRAKKHTLSDEIEKILAMSEQVSQTAYTVFSQLDNVDLTFGKIQNDKGEMVELSHGNFSTFLQSANRQLRKQAFEQYYASYDQHKNTLAAALSQSIKKDVFYSKVRKYDSCRQQGLFGDHVPEQVYDNLVMTIRQNLQSLFAYLGLRKKALQIPTLHFYDTYVPIVEDLDFSLNYQSAVETCVAAAEPLGQEYMDVMSDGLINGWVDRYENKGKRSGAYSSGCYDSPPYILMNYEENNINSLYTLMHEAGHSMHSYLANRQQPYHYHDYTIFAAEVASTFNETLLTQYLMSHYQKDSRMMAYIVNREVDNIRATLFRQTMFAEFEKICHAQVEQNQPLTLEVMSGEYYNLLKDYFGDTLVIDDLLQLEYLRIPHFYSPFYVYKYATGISAALFLAQRVLSGGSSERQAYQDFLKIGGSQFPLDSLLVAGVDMTSPEPVQKAINYFGQQVTRLGEWLS